MARYDYKCLNCGVFEIQQSMKEDSIKRCPKCQGEEFSRVFGNNLAIKFKGSGFYVNDYKKSDSSFDKYKPREEGTKKFY